MKRRVVESLPTAEADITLRKPKIEIDVHDLEEEFSDLNMEKFTELASPYLKNYHHNARFLDKQ